MDDKTYSITLADGTKLENLKMNGNNFVSKEPVERSTFEYNLSKVVINDGEDDVTYENMELVQITTMDGDYLFILRQLTKKEMDDLKLRSDLEYLAMMVDVEL